MTNELEKTFFDTFGIKPSTKYDYCWKSGENKDKLYPQITDHILLELICIHNQYSYPLTIHSTKKEFLKNYILECTIDIINYFYGHEMGEYSKLKRQVQALFEEE